MTLQTRLLILSALAAASPAVSAQAADQFHQIGAMTLPGKTLAGFDVGWVDQESQRYYLADRDNGQLDIFDARTDKYIGAAPGFVGPKFVKGKESLALSGPSGVLVFGNTAWVADGDSTAKEVDLKTLKIVATVSTGGKKRFDEIAYDPKDHVLLGINPEDDPPFATLISTTQHKAIAKLPFKNATDGLEQAAYNPGDGLFYLPVPEYDHDPKKNGLVIIAPDGKIVKSVEIANCHPHGTVFGPKQNLLIGCSADGKEGMPPILLVMDVTNDKIVATVEGAGGADEVAYDKKRNEYFASSTSLNGVFVIDAATNKLVQKIDAHGHSHSVAVNEANGRVFIPEINSGGGCGCVRVFAPAEPEK